MCAQAIPAGISDSLTDLKMRRTISMFQLNSTCVMHVIPDDFPPRLEHHRRVIRCKQQTSNILAILLVLPHALFSFLTLYSCILCNKLIHHTS
jgi:hypothetical protein